MARKQLPTRAAAKLLKISRMKSGMIGEIDEIHRLQEQVLSKIDTFAMHSAAAMRRRSPDADWHIKNDEAEIARAKSERTQLSERYTAVCVKKSQLLELEMNLTAFLRSAGYLLPGEESPRGGIAIQEVQRAGV